MRKNLFLAIIISTLLILTVSIVMAYKEEITDSKEKIINYIKEKVNQNEIEDFQRLSPVDKFIQAGKLQQERNKLQAETKAAETIETQEASGNE